MKNANDTNFDNLSRNHSQAFQNLFSEASVKKFFFNKVILSKEVDFVIFDIRKFYKKFRKYILCNT